MQPKPTSRLRGATRAAAPLSRLPRHIEAATDAAATQPLRVPFPLILQQRAKHAVRRHMLRGFYRTLVLGASDITAVLLLVGLLGPFLAERAASLPPLAHAARAVVPGDPFGVAQFVTTVVLGLFVTRTYGPSDRRRDPRALAAGSLLGVALVSWHGLWIGFSWARLLGLLALAAVVVGTIVVQRALLDLLVRWIRPINDLASRVLIVASADEAREARGSLALSNPGEFRVVGFLDTAAHPVRDALGGVGDLVRAVEREHVDTVVFYGQLGTATFSRLVALSDAAGCQVLCVPRAFALPGYEPQLVWHSGEPLVQVTRPGRRGQQMLVKTGVDLATSLASLLLLAPLLAVVAGVVKLTSPGPVLFSQERVGQGGRRFRMYKFRSMVQDAEARRDDLAGASVYPDPRLFKVHNDPRITPVGAFLRRTSLDELPQLWNVLRGDMSFVGPRPERPEFVASLTREIPFYGQRHSVRPGLTGWAQVRYTYGASVEDAMEKLQYDLFYIKNMSIALDLFIIANTVKTVLMQRGAH